MKKVKYWYFITYYECPVCGRGSEFRERRYTEKPTDINDRYEFIQLYDYCEGY
jgi:hypothetical protein